MKRAFRVTKRKYGESAFDGLGARLAGGRWNYPGIPAVYCSETRALAVLETFVHLGEEASAIPFLLIEVHIPESVRVGRLGRAPRGWRLEPPADESMRAGTEWLKQGESAVLEVPSALIPEEHNLLINPMHGDFSKLKMLPPVNFSFDVRMWK